MLHANDLDFNAKKKSSGSLPWKIIFSYLFWNILAKYVYQNRCNYNMFVNNAILLQFMEIVSFPLQIIIKLTEQLP